MMLNLLAAADVMEHILPHRLWKFGPVVINNQVLMAIVAALLMLMIFPRMFNRPRLEAPSGARNFFESILEFLRVEVIRPALKEKTDRFLPFLWTVFFFILFCNLLGSIPLAEVVELITNGKVEHIGGAATGNLNTTGILALCAFLFIHINGIDEIARALMNGTYGHHAHHDEHSSDGGRGHESAHDLEHGRGDALAADIPNNFRAVADPTHHYTDDEHAHPQHAAEAIAAGDHSAFSDTYGTVVKVSPAAAIFMAVPLYFWNFAPHPFKPKPGEGIAGWFADIPMWAMLLLLELIGACIKPIALALRLFANMIAGHLVLAALVGLITLAPTVMGQIGIGVPVTVLSLLIRVLELFVAFLQAYIFTFLTTLFIASAVAPEH